jgi:hypothetical protein
LKRLTAGPITPIQIVPIEQPIRQPVPPTQQKNRQPVRDHDNRTITGDDQINVTREGFAKECNSPTSEFDGLLGHGAVACFVVDT